MTTTSPAARHRRFAATFSELVNGTSNWEAPAPVAGWTALDVVDHVVGWLTGFLEAGSGIRLPGGPPVAEDPVAAWRTHADGVQALLDDPASASQTLSNRHTGDQPVAQAIDRFYTSDVFLHSWDLAQASGQSLILDPVECAALLAGMEPVEDLMRSSGQYGPRVPVPDDAPVQGRLLGFIGRDPAWAAG